MKYITQFLWILAFTLVGEVLQALIPLPIPAAIYGMVLLLIALGTGLLKTSQVKHASKLLISIMPVLYVPVCVGILEHLGVLSANAAAIITITVVSTFLVFAVSSLVTKLIAEKKEGKKND